MHSACEDLNMPVEPKKIGKASRDYYLPQPRAQFSHPGNKTAVGQVETTLSNANWMERAEGLQTDLLSIIGLLIHTGRAVRPEGDMQEDSLTSP